MRRGSPPRRAPEFPDGLEWLNTDRSLNLEQLRGKIVVLDFWTYGCINSLHLLPDLRRLSAKYREDLVVVGVHSARFSAERDLRHLRAAILRHEIDHPVVNDRDMRIWRDYGVRAWPTTALLDPFGRIVDRRSGERVFDAYDPMIRRMILQYSPAGHIDHTPLEGGRERDRAVRGLLSFPAKLLADGASERLFISDTNHNRIVICTLDGEVLDVAGSGVMGLADGSFDAASFHHPHGMALDGSVLYVADTENHCIRRLDIARREVLTIAGTGEQAPIFAEDGRGTRDPMNSPWDLELVGDWLYIAMAGPHQIWRLRTRSAEFEAYIGGGREDLVDGRRLEASLAQPSALVSDGSRLHFADSQSSAIRWAYLPPNSFVGTTIGAGLFEYGDRDGGPSDALLQHPRGLAYCAGDLLVADTYNNRVKRLNPRTNRIETILGTGEPGLRDGEAAQFHEPGGIDACADRIFIADTNNHAIRVTGLSGGPVTTLRLHPASRLEPLPTASSPLPPRELREQTTGVGEVSVVISVDPGPDHVLDTEAPVSAHLTIDADALRIEGVEADLALTGADLPLSLTVHATEGATTVHLRLRFHYHSADVAGAAYFEDIELGVPVRVEAGASEETIRLHYSLPERLTGG